MSPAEQPGAPAPTRPSSSWRDSRVLRAGWVVAVVGVATAVVVREWPRVSDQVGDLSWPLIAASVLLTVLAKLALGENARLAADRHGIELSRVVAARLYNLSQLGKYVPGSVWQFVGRAVAYRDRGARLGAIRDALATESLWVVGGAGAVGLALGGGAVLPVVAGGLSRTVLVWLATGLLVILVAGVVLTALRWRAVVSYARAATPTPTVLAVQSVVWLLLGSGFWCLCRAAAVDVTWPYAVGLFAAAYAVGFAVLFAPAGLGVRDAILVAGLLPAAGPETGVLVAVVARLVYVGVELAMVGVGELAWWRRATRTDLAAR